MGAIRPRPALVLPALILGAALPAVLTPALSAQEPVDEDAVAAIRRHGLEESQVMDLLSWICDVHGPRLTASPGMKRAQEWALTTLRDWGLEAHLEPWGPFGRGWQLEHLSFMVLGEQPWPVIAAPKAWCDGTGGPVEAEVVLFDPADDEDLAPWKERLQGKIVLVEEPREVEEPFEALATRHDAESLLALANAAPPRPRQRARRGGGGPERSAWAERMRRRAERLRFLWEAEPAAILDRGYKGDYGTLFVSSASVPPGADGQRRRPWDAGAGRVIPQLTLAVEHYNRLVRLLRKGQTVRARLDLAVSWHEGDGMAANVIGEIPGSDPEVGREVVMLGGHFDSWHAGTGTTDNGCGCAVMMEAVRILRATYEDLGRRPRRTIRIALWSGEEQGLLGSRAYVREHFGSLDEGLKPEHALLSAYYNLDNGSGRIRGVYLQGNAAVAPVFRAWLEPFRDLDAATLTIRNTGGTDHLSFDAVRLPGFQFIQDPLAYGTRTHHSNMDVWDHAVADDLKQAATIVAGFVYHTAERDGLLPRKPLPEGVPGRQPASASF